MRGSEKRTKRREEMKCRFSMCVVFVCVYVFCVSKTKQARICERSTGHCSVVLISLFYFFRPMWAGSRRFFPFAFSRWGIPCLVSPSCVSLNVVLRQHAAQFVSLVCRTLRGGAASYLCGRQVEFRCVWQSWVCGGLVRSTEDTVCAIWVGSLVARPVYIMALDVYLTWATM